jgi:hypothetical protein
VFSIGVVVIATNAYFVLGVRFIKKFMHHYKGRCSITFYFFSDTDPSPFLPDNVNVKHIKENHLNWRDGTNSKFKNIISIENCGSDYLYYFDADTNVTTDFDENWFLGELVGGEHYGNRGWLKNGAGYDKNPKSKAYVPVESKLAKTYYYGAFFGGKKERVIQFCKILREWQLEDKKISYEPAVNDESYINAYFHYNPPHTIAIENFKFNISDKGGIGETRNPKLDTEQYKSKLLEIKDSVFDIRGGDIC